MNTKISQGLRVEEIRPRLIVSHNEKDLVFLAPAYGPGNYTNIALKIEKDSLARPTMAETASLIYSAFAFNSDDKYSKEIKKKIMIKRLFWAFTGNLYIPNKGAYIQDNPEIRNGMPFMEESELIKKLESNDNSVRFVHFGFKIGRMSALELAKNPYVIGLAGEEGAEKIGEVADKYEGKPYLYCFKSVDQPVTRVSALSSYWDIDIRLDIYGVHVGNRNGYAFGVQKTGEASRIEK